MERERSCFRKQKNCVTGGGVRDETIRGGDPDSIGAVDMKCKAFNETECA